VTWKGLAEGLRLQGQTAMFVLVDGVAAGVLGVSDPIKENARAAIAELRRAGLHLVMLTGDHRVTAQHVAKQLGISDVEAEVQPAHKREVIQRLQAQGRVVAMAGDGVNDAPALAQANVGIAMGSGTDVAIQSAGITLLKGDLQGVVKARHLSRATMRNIRANLVFALATIYWVFRWRLGFVSRRRHSFEPHVGQCRHELELRVRHRQCIAFATFAALMQSWDSSRFRQGFGQFRFGITLLVPI
jgi:P-type E1-E2 ATPase